jgi:hypothetical protein
MRRYWFIPAAILLIIAAACFLLGWVQLRFSPNSYGVAFTRAHGFEREVVRPQGITWRWERLVPGLLTLYVFPLDAQSVEIPVTGSLPSGETYSALSAEKPDFTFELRLSLLYSLKPDVLPGLADTSRLRPDSLSGMYSMLAQEIASKAAALSLAAPTAASGGGAEETSGARSIEALTARIESEIPKAFPHIQFHSITAVVVHAPDTLLYERLRETYLRVTAAREETLKSAAVRLAAQEADLAAAEKRHQRTVTVLEKYGELLDKHPSLIATTGPSSAQFARGRSR